MSDRTLELVITLDLKEHVEDDELDALTQQLREEILETDVNTVDSPSLAKAPPGARVFETVTLGTLLVTLAASGGVITTLIGTIKEWLTRNETHSITLEINGDKISLTGASSQQEERLIKEWIKRHKKE